MNSDIYKKEEKEHYDFRYSGVKEYRYPSEDDISTNDKVNIAARHYIEKKAFDIMNRLGKGEILDYGCATGEKTYRFASENWRITGIDISTNSIKIANEISTKNNNNSAFYEMDCENLEFEDNRFDIIYDFGTFSSIDMKKALPEICRVMKPDGYVLSIETLGNNPLMKIKRRLNVLFGSRTRWASQHIMKIKDWEEYKSLFSEFEIRYFSLTTIYVSMFLRLIPKSKHYGLISFFDRIDVRLLKYRICQLFAFKTVAVMSNPVQDRV